MNRFPIQRRTLVMLAVIIPLLALLAFVALRTGPMAAVPVTVATVRSDTITPALFGIGTVEARYTYRIGPTVAGRIKRLDVHVGDRVRAGQVLGEMDPVDIDDRIRAQDAAQKRAEATLREAEARQSYAQAQARRYEQLIAVRSTSEEVASAKRQEALIADAALAAAREDVLRVRADRAAIAAQRGSLRLVAPVDGLVAVRDADPGTTIVAGQSVVQVIDPASLWINVRFDQIAAKGLAAGLPARVVLRSRHGETLSGRVLRIDPMADTVTEEILAKVVFDNLPDPLPPVGELAEITVLLPPLASTPLVPNAALQRQEGKRGVWQIAEDGMRFAPVETGAADLDGHVQVHQGLKDGDRVVVYSEKALSARSRIKVVEHIPGAAR